MAAMIAVVFVVEADLAAVAVNTCIAIRHRRVGGKIFAYQNTQLESIMMSSYCRQMACQMQRHLCDLR